MAFVLPHFSLFLFHSSFHKFLLLSYCQRIYSMNFHRYIWLDAANRWFLPPTPVSSLAFSPSLHSSRSVGCRQRRRRHATYKNDILLCIHYTISCRSFENGMTISLSVRMCATGKRQSSHRISPFRHFPVETILNGLNRMCLLHVYDACIYLPLSAWHQNWIEWMVPYTAFSASLCVCTCIYPSKYQRQHKH